MKDHVVKFLRFLEAKEGKAAPLKLKLLNPGKFKVTKDDLNVKGDLDLSNTGITTLPDGLQVSGNLTLNSCTSLKSLPDGLHVGNDLFLSGCTSLTSISDGLRVSRDLDLRGCTSLKELPNGLQVDRSLYLISCTSLKVLPNSLKVGWSLYLGYTPIAKVYSVDEIRAMIEAKGGYVDKKIYG